jgi:predicted transcriptional regulator
MPAQTDKPVPTSLKLPPALKAQIDASAQKAGISAHAFMVKTLADATERTRLRDQFQQDSMDALREVETTGMAFDFDDVRDYFAKRVLWRQGAGTEPPMPAQKPWRGRPAG